MLIVFYFVLLQWGETVPLTQGCW